MKLSLLLDTRRAGGCLTLGLLALLAVAPSAEAQPAAAPPVAEAAPATPGAGHATDLAPSAGERPAIADGTLALLHKLEARHSPVKTVHAKFQQVRADEVFDEQIKSAGELWYDKPSHFRCDYADPQPMVTLVSQDALYIYTPELKQVDYWQFESAAERDAQLDHLLIAFNFKVNQLAARYRITSSEDDTTTLAAELAKSEGGGAGKALFYLRPQPHFEDAAPFSELKVWIDKKTLLPEKIWYLDRTGSSVTVTMTDLKLDEQLATDLFNRKKIIPGDAEYVNKRDTQ